MKKLIFCFLFIFIILSNGIAKDNMTEKRKNMVNSQIISRGIKNIKVINALLNVKRHDFVSTDYEDQAYNDYPLPIGHQQTISQPYIVALMSELINPDKKDKVLEIGTGSGYQTAVLSKIVKEIHSIEIIPELAEQSKKLLKEKGFKNVHVYCKDGYKGLPEEAPFDKIIVTAAPPEIPEALIDQLKTGGLMVIPVGTFFQELILIEKTKDGINKKDIIPVRFVPMVREVKD